MEQTVNHARDFSSLPDSILINILSLLPLKKAVSTSILAKPWRGLWRLRPHFEINERLFPPAYTENETANNKHLRESSFLNFGRDWILHQNINLLAISSFSLVFSNPLSYELEITNFINFALVHQPNSLELDFSDLNWDNRLPNNSTLRNRFVLPQIVYRFDSLVSLKLVSCQFRSELFRNIGRNIKSVSLGWINITNASILKSVTRHCPMLEHLSLHKCAGATVYEIDATRLKTLEVIKCIDLENLTVVAPNLICFKYSGSVIQFGMCYIQLLEEVTVDFELAGFLDTEHSDDIVSLLSNKFYYAKSLKICAYTTQVISLALDFWRLARRPCAKELTIRTSFHEYEFCGILCLLNSYVVLEKLCFEVGQQTIFEEDYVPPLEPWRPERFWSDMKPLATGCMNRTLKFVEIDGFRGSPNEFNVLMFLLAQGCRALRKVILRIDRNFSHAEGLAMGIRHALQSQFSHIEVTVIKPLDLP